MQYPLVTVLVWSLLFTDVVSQLCPNLIGHIIFPEYYFQFVNGKYIRRKCPQGTVFHRPTCQCDHPRMTGSVLKVPQTNSLNPFQNTFSQAWGQRAAPGMMERFGNFQNNMQPQTPFNNFFGRMQNGPIRFNLKMARSSGPATSNMQTQSIFAVHSAATTPKVPHYVSSTVESPGNSSANTTPDKSAPLRDITAPSSHPLPIDTPPSNAKTTLLNINDMNPLPSPAYQVPTFKSSDTVIKINSGLADTLTTSPKPSEMATTTLPNSSFGNAKTNPSNAMNSHSFGLSRNANTNIGWNNPLWAANVKNLANQRQSASVLQSSQPGFQTLPNTSKPNIMNTGSWPNNNFKQFNMRSQVNQQAPSNFFNRMAQLQNQLRSFNNLLNGNSSPTYPSPPTNPRQNNLLFQNPMQFKSVLKQQFNNMPTTPFPQSFVPDFSRNQFQMNNNPMNGVFSQTPQNNMPLNSPMPAIDLAIQNQLVNKVGANFAGMSGTNWMPNPQLHWSQNIRMADMMEVTDAQRDAYVRQELMTNTNLTPEERLSLTEIMQ